MLRIVDDGTIELPALTSAHSHAFQRAMRGLAQRPARADERGDFWSWRGAMYAVAAGLTPESVHEISRVAYRELRRAGVSTVGEFHYVHHQPDGTPYDDRLAMADAVIAAARAEGLRVCLLRVAYHRAGAGRAVEPGQRRFCDPTADAVLRDVDALRVKYRDQADVRIGLAPHSVRAVPPDWLGELAAYAHAHALPLHMHVAEQPREIDECVAETGRRPVELLSERGVLSNRFVAVHATHLAPHEATLLGDAAAFACICASTEADLGDGLADVTRLRAAGARLCTGVDSHVLTDVVADVRALETGERLRSGRRVTFSPAAGSPAEQLWREGSVEGAAACGFDDAGGVLQVSRAHVALELVADDALLDAIVFGGGSHMVTAVR